MRPALACFSLALLVGCVDLARPTVLRCPQEGCADAGPDAEVEDGPAATPDAEPAGADATTGPDDAAPPDTQGDRAADGPPAGAPDAAAADGSVRADGPPADAPDAGPLTLPRSGLVLHLSAGMGVSRDGDTVVMWGDLSGRGNDATQNGRGKRPRWVDGAVGGQPAVHFDGRHQLELPRMIENDFTVVVVFAAAAGIGTENRWPAGAGIFDGDVAGATADFGISINAMGRVIAGTGSPDVNTASATGHADRMPHVATFRRVRATGVIELWVDGGVAGTATGSTGSLAAPPRFTLGSLQTDLNYFAGHIAEVLAWTAALPDEQRAGVEAALMQKYAVKPVGR